MKIRMDIVWGFLYFLIKFMDLIVWNVGGITNHGPIRVVNFFEPEI